jgi:glyoxylase-like metal-dependent hydrolase (beta-lactamase superfamily II)
MYLDAFSDNSFETNCWLIGTDDTDEAVVVDPGFSPDRVHGMLEAEGKRAVAVLATHGHFDHIGSAASFCGDELPFYIHEGDVLALTDTLAWGAGYETPRLPHGRVGALGGPGLRRRGRPERLPELRSRGDAAEPPPLPRVAG